MSWLVLDASRYQTFTDYTATAADLDGVIIRCGLRGYSSGAITKDSKLDVHYNGFYGKTSKSGITIRTGFYWYTCAMSDDEALEEAEYINNLLSTKWNDFPIFINSDYGSEDHDGRADDISVEDRMQYLTTLGTRLRDLNYRVGVYCTQEWLDTKLDYQELKDHHYNIWIASDTEPTVDDYEAWRYTDQGLISGISSRVSLSRVYKDIANWLDTRININSLDAWIESPVTYNGTLVTPAPVGIDGLTYLVDYTVEYCNAAAASKLPYALLEGIGNYTGTKNVSYEILPADITQLALRLNKDGWRYTGEEIKPYVVCDTDSDLGRAFSSSQYNITYIDNVWPGEATATVTGKNNFKGTVELHFYIEGQVPFPSRPYLESNEFTYTGEPIEPKVICGRLVEGTDFTVEYTDNVEAGLGTVIVTGINNYEGDSEEIQFSIKQVNIATTASIRYNESRYEYKGRYIEPTFTITVSYGDIVHDLIEGVDYTYQYRNNFNAGQGVIAIEGMGNCTGTYYAYFTIEPAPLSKCLVELDHDTFEYTGAPIEPEVYVEFNDTEMSSNHYTIVYTNNIKVGTNAMVTVIGRNNLTGTYKTNFEITTKSGDDFWMLDEAEFTYTGEAFTPTPICMTDDPVPGRDYTVEYENNINAGIGKCTVTMIGNYTYKKVYLYFTIHPQEIDISKFSLDEVEFLYNRKYIKPNVIYDGSKYILDQDYTVKYYNNKYPEENAYVKIKGINNYGGDYNLPFHIARVEIDKIAHIDMGDPIKYDVYDPANFKVVTEAGDELVIYDDYIYDFKTVTFEKNATYNYTVYIVTGIGPCTGTIVKGYRTSIAGKDPEIPQWAPRVEEIIEEEIAEEIPIVIISDEPEELKPPVYIDPYALSEKWIPEVNPVIPDDPEDINVHSGEYMYIRKCSYYSSPYTKFPEAELLNGTFYVYHWKQVNGKIRVTLDSMNAKIVGHNTGWIDMEDLLNDFRIKVGDKVEATFDYIYYDRYSTDGRIYKKNQVLYVVYIDHDYFKSSDVNIGLSMRENGGIIGWASMDMLDYYIEEPT